MSSNAEVKEASLTGPVATTTTASGGLRGVIRYASSEASTTSAAFPSIALGDGRTMRTMPGKWLRVYNEHATADLDFAFGAGAAPSLTSKEVANLPDGDVNAGVPIFPKTYQDFVIPLDATHMGWRLSTGASASTVAFFVSEGPVGDK